MSDESNGNGNKPKVTKLSFSDLVSRYEELSMSVKCDCVFGTQLVGGLPADRDGLAAFVKHYLKITDPKEAEEAIARISRDELGVKTTTPPLGEYEERESYGVRVIRRTEFGYYIANHQLKACSKQAASRIGVFVDTDRSKGAFAESSRLYAIGDSLREADHPERIYLTLPEGVTRPEFQEFTGRVSTPTGQQSIVHHSEVVPPGTKFSFEWRLVPDLLKPEDIRDTLAMMMICGCGSAKSLECGRYRILSAEITEPAARRMSRSQKSAQRKQEEADRKKAVAEAKEAEKVAA